MTTELNDKLKNVLQTDGQVLEMWHTGGNYIVTIRGDKYLEGEHAELQTALDDVLRKYEEWSEAQEETR